MTHRYLEPSPILADGSAQVGKLPGSIPLHDLRDLRHPESPIKAIRAKCLDCSGGNDAGSPQVCGDRLHALALPHGRQPVSREGAIMSCEIIQFSTAARIPPKRAKAIVRAAGISRLSRVELEPAMKANYPQPARMGVFATNAMRFGGWPRQRRVIGELD